MTNTTLDRPRKGLSRDEKLARAKEAVEQLLTSEGWENWAAARRRFHTYSLGNQLLIAFQRPDARQVAGKKRWQDLGYRIKKGSKALYIWAPAPIKTGVIVDGEEERRMMFKLVAVFSDLEVEPYREDAAPLAPPVEWAHIDGDEHSDKLGTLVTWAESQDVQVHYRTLHGPRGSYNPTTRSIALEATLSPNGQLHTLIHELCHHLDHTRDTESYADGEVLVETAAWMVCQTIGLEAGASSVPYLASWATNGGDLERMNADAATIDEMARTIEAVIAAE